MGGFVALVGYLLVLNTGFGRSQETCYPGGDVTIAGSCIYQKTCVNDLFTSMWSFPPPQPSSPCAAAAYTCSTNTLSEPSVTYYIITCTSALNTPVITQVVSTPLLLTGTTPVVSPAPIPSPSDSTPVAPATSTLFLPTVPTLSIPVPTISSISSQSASVSKASSTTSSSNITPSSSAVTSSQIVSSRFLASPSTASYPYPVLPTYTGGYLLRNYCSAVEFTLLPGPKSTLVIYAGFIGCVNDKPDCCPFVVKANTSKTTTTISAAITTVSLGLSASSSTTSSNPPSVSTVFVQPPPPGTAPVSSQSTTVTSASASTRPIFPAAAVQAQATLSICPQDYHMISSSCCPIGYILYTTEVAGITPCYSPLSSTLNVTPPPGLTLEPTILPGSTSISDSAGALLPSTTLSTAISAPQTYTQIINNAYLADPFPVQPPSSGPNVSRGDIAAIILSSLGGMATLLSWLFWRKRRASSGFQKKGYTIAWIAPLEMDALAARNMLDHIHKAVKFPAGQGVDFIYTVGDINGHNIVIATFPSGHSAGVGAAASLARDIKAKFPNVLLTLLVGVAGGIPDFSQAPPWDIRRGDVLVAEGEEGGPCVISYGSGTETAQNLVVAKTSAMLFGAVIGQMKGAGEDRWTSFRTHYQKLLTEDCNNKFQDPGQDNDRFLTTPQGLAAGPANPLPMQRRRRPDNERVQVWYGKLASGDDLRENPQQRRQLKERYDIKGFETGAASVMDVFEKVGVIRGVCDYGDGQQTREWQPYAAATAAAYAKAVLCNIDPDTDLNRTEEQGAQPEGGSGKNPGEPATVEIELLPTPKISLKISLRRLFGWLND